MMTCSGNEEAIKTDLPGDNQANQTSQPTSDQTIEKEKSPPEITLSPVYGEFFDDDSPAISGSVSPGFISRDAMEEQRLSFHFTIPSEYKSYIKGEAARPLVIRQPYVEQDSMDPIPIEQGIEITAVLPQQEGERHEDPYLGEYWTISDTVDYEVTLQIVDSTQLGDSISLMVYYQLCTETVCMDGVPLQATIQVMN